MTGNTKSSLLSWRHGPRIVGARERLSPIIDAGDARALEALLRTESGLPGPRGNLELAAALADLFDARVSDPTTAGQRVANWQPVFDSWLALPTGTAAGSGSDEYLPFCAAGVLAASYLAADPDREQTIVVALERAANDSRWRVREAVAIAYQRPAEHDFAVVARLVADWLPQAGLLERRAIIAGLAHPPILGDPAVARRCLDVADEVMRGLLALPASQRKTDPYRVLRQALEYALSVFVAPSPDEGFALLARWAAVSDPDAQRIVRSNLGKARLARAYPDRVAALV